VTIARRIGRPIVALTCGKRRWQRAWRVLQELSLLGLNYGRATVDESGEESALRYAADRVPDAAILFDVGANSGDWTFAAQRTWPHATVHAFEPAHDTYRRLVERTHGAVCVQAALGNADAEATLYAVAGQSGLSSLHRRDLEAHAMTMTPAESVQVITLDGYCTETGIDRIDYLKIDAEGHDLAVLQGASRMLAAGAIRFVQFEFGGCNIDSRTFLRDFVRLLEPRYRLWRMLADGLDPLVYSERDEVFITSNFLAELNRP
jgi:FkbM family methyltransferase